MARAQAKTAVAKREPQHEAQVIMPEGLTDDFLAEVAADAGKGLEKVTIQDMALPFLTILQALSPQVQKRGGEYVDGAEPGMIFNTVTMALYERLIVVPASYVTRYTEWKPRDSGGGLVRDWGEDSSLHDRCHRDERNRMVTPTGTNVVKSATFYGLIHPSQERFVIAFSSTQLKKGRQWTTQAENKRIKDQAGKLIQPPLFFESYELTTVGESNEKGEWFGWRVVSHKPTVMLPDGRAFYAEAKRLAADVIEKKVQVKAEALAGETQDQGGVNDTIPF